MVYDRKKSAERHYVSEAPASPGLFFGTHKDSAVGRRRGNFCLKQDDFSNEEKK